MKSLEDLKKLRDEEKVTLGIRQEIDHHSYAHIKVGMSTSGIEAGARDTLNAILGEIAKAKLEKVAIYPVAFDGDISKAPAITVSMPDKDDVYYVNIDQAKAVEIVQKHIIGGNVVSEYTA